MLLTTGTNKLADQLFGQDAFIGGSIVDGGGLDIDYSDLQFYAARVLVLHSTSDNGSLTLVDNQTRNIYGNNVGAIASKIGALSAGETLLAVVVTAGGVIVRITMQEFANLPSLSERAVQDHRFVLNGNYYAQGVGEAFDGPIIALVAGKITHVAVMHDVAGDPVGDVTIDIKINGTTIWTVTTPPVLDEEATIAVGINPVVGDARDYGPSDIITCEFSAITAKGGSPADITVMIRMKGD